MHEETELQEIDCNSAYLAPLGSGTVCRLQALPFQRSATGRPAREPTARQALEAVQTTLSASHWTALRLGVGVVSIAQLEPFQRSASVLGPSPESVTLPTAVQAVVAVQEMADRPPPPVGVTGVCADHAELFHTRAIGVRTLWTGVCACGRRAHRRAGTGHTRHPAEPGAEVSR